MYKLYEKVPRTDEYEYGIKAMEEDKNPFKESPCLLSMIAIAMWEKDVNGALNQGMEALRLKTNHNENTGIELEDFDGKILSMAYGEPSERITKKGRRFTGIAGKEKLDDEFTEKYLFPLIETEGKRIDVLQAMKNMRNVNIMAYCNANNSALRIEECLVNRMNELGYSEDEISKIQSQMCIIGYATDVKMNAEFVKNKKIKSTYLSFGDVNDGEVSTSQGLREDVKNKNTVYYNNGYYFHYGNGEHTVKHYILQSDSLSLGISSVLTRAISNSIENHNSERFKPLTKELLTQNIEKIIEGIRQGKKREELTPLIDNGINYTERDGKDSKTSQFNMNEDEIKTQEIEEKIAQKSGKSIEDVRKEYDRIIKTSNVNKDGKELYILRKITSKEILKGHYTNKGRYSIYTREGLYSGFIDVTISNSNKANKAEIEYKSVPEQRNKGNMTTSLEEVLSDIFIDNSFDNLTVRDIFPKTKIGEVFLAINSDNYASQAVANKIGFQQNGTIYKMTKEQFLQRVQGKKFTEQEIGKATIDRETTKKDKAQSQEKQDEQEILKTKEDESQLD